MHKTQESRRVRANFGDDQTALGAKEFATLVAGKKKKKKTRNSNYCGEGRKKKKSLCCFDLCGCASVSACVRTDLKPTRSSA